MLSRGNTVHRMRTVTARWGALALLATVVASCAGPGRDQAGPSPSGSQAVRPSMESVLDRYEAMERDMVAALDEQLPGLTWEVNSGGLGLVRAGCADEDASDTAEEVSLLKHMAPGTLDPADWHRSVEVVQSVGERYGFDSVTTVVDRPDDLEIIGEDGFGGRYRFGMAVNTILSVTTGCHEWDAVPAEGGERPSPIVG